MKAIAAAVRAYVRGHAVSGVLRRFGVDARRYWLLIDLFGELTERREMFGHLGRDGITLRTAAIMYAILASLISVVQVLLGVSVLVYFVSFLALSGFLLVTILMSETANSLVNPVEGLVLAHHPIDGATYTAAKLTHLLRVLAYTVPALNLVPAAAGLFLPHARWHYPIVHLVSAGVLGLVIALCCCAFFGMLIRLLPPARLKTVGPLAEAAPILLLLLSNGSNTFLKRFNLKAYVSALDAATLRGIGIVAVVAAIAGVVFGLRALSGDYLVRVSAIMHGRSGRGSMRARRTPIAAAIARLAGGRAESQAARAGFEYVRRLALRDWQFRRQLLAVLPAASLPVMLLFDRSRTTPFSGPFTPMHVLPHALGAVIFVVCTVLASGSDYKGAWLFLTVPNTTFHGFVRGVNAFLWMSLIGIPHAVIYAVLVRHWAVGDASLFIAFSLAVASLYLALSLRMVEGVPFGKPVDTSRGAVLLPLMLGGAFTIAIVVAFQHFFLFRSRPLVGAVAFLTAMGVGFIARASLQRFEVAVRFHLGLVSQESTMLYKEVG